MIVIMRFRGEIKIDVPNLTGIEDPHADEKIGEVWASDEAINLAGEAADLDTDNPGASSWDVE